MKVTVNQWVPVAVWKWPEVSGGDDVCGICRSQFEATCPSCLTPGYRCPPLSGQCSHSFHEHCIEKWLQRNQEEASCPMCRRPFVPVGEEPVTNEEHASRGNAPVQDEEMDEGAGDRSSFDFNTV